MNEQTPGIRGRWWRFSDYKIYEGAFPENLPAGLEDNFRYICPAPGATLESYEPTFENPSESGFGDIKEGVIGLDTIQELDESDEESILAWCRSYGLLGVLCQTAEWIRLPPRWGRLFPKVTDSPLVPTQRHYFRYNVGWKSSLKAEMVGTNKGVLVLEDIDRFEDWNAKLVQPDETGYSPAGAFASPLFSNQHEFKTLTEALGNYFPMVPRSELESYEYPMPLSEGFWHQYAEPLGTFRRTIRRLKEIPVKLSQAGPLDLIPSDMLRTALDGRAELHSILSVSPGIGLELDGSYSPKWAFSSLIAMLGFSFWQRLVAGESLRQCGRSRCRKLFFSRLGSKRYCSDKCRNNEEKSRQRKRMSSH